MPKCVRIKVFVSRFGRTNVLRGLENAPIDCIMKAKRIDWSVGGLCRLGLFIIKGDRSCAAGACTFTCPSERRPFTCQGGTDDW